MARERFEYHEVEAEDGTPVTIGIPAGDWDPENPFAPYCEGRVEGAWAAVAFAPDWKAPIDTYVEVDNSEVQEATELIAFAVFFYTATEARIDTLGNPGQGRGFGGTVLHVVADGYRAGPAGP
jgi:hypothetical protein